MAINGAVELTYLKTKWGSDVRRTSLRHSHDLTLNDLLLMMQRVFNIDQAAAIFLKYRDSEGDLVSLTNDEDVLHALKDGHGSLFVHVFSASGDQKDLLDLEAKLEELQVGVARALDALHSLALAAPPAHATAPKSEIEDDREKTKTFSVASQEEEAEEVEEDVPLNTSGVVQPPPVYSSPKEVAPPAPKPVVEQQQPHYPPPPTDHQLQHHHQQQQHQQYTVPQAQPAYQAQQQQQQYYQQQQHHQQQQPLTPAYPNWSQAPPPTPTTGFVLPSPPTPATGFVPPPPPTGVSMSGYGGAPNPFAPRQRTSYPLPQQMNGQQQQKTGQLEDVPLNTPYTTPVPPTSTSSPFGAPPTTHAGYQGQQYYSTANYGQNGHAPAAYPSTYNGTL